MYAVSAIVQTFTPYPQVIPVTLGGYNSRYNNDLLTQAVYSGHLNGSGSEAGNRSTSKATQQFFSIQWTVICNGHIATCTNLLECLSIIACDNLVQPQLTNSLR